MVKAVGLEPRPVTVREVAIPSPTGALHGHVHAPQACGRYPLTVLVPGGASPGAVHDAPGHAVHLRAVDLAAMGVCVLHYDPSGRGKSPGVEDHWGPVHQDELAAALRFALAQPEANPDNAGVFSFSIGVTIAAGALARHDLPAIRYLLDWEGPSDRFIATKHDTHPPLREFPTTNEAFWRDREAVSFLPALPCGYCRYQARTDHVQGSVMDHATAMVNAAVRRPAEGVANDLVDTPWTRLNGLLVQTPFEDGRDPRFTRALVEDADNHAATLARQLLMCQGRLPWPD